MLIGDGTLRECAQSTCVPKLDIIPATVDLSGAEIELVEFQERTHRLAHAIARGERPWDVVLVDHAIGDADREALRWVKGTLNA